MVDKSKPYGRYAKLPMPSGCLYLNNNGDKWIANDMRFVLVLPNGTRKIRLADYYYSFGNFSGISYRYKGVRYSGLPKSANGFETHNENAKGQEILPHIFHQEKRNV